MIIKDLLILWESQLGLIFLGANFDVLVNNFLPIFRYCRFIHISCIINNNICRHFKKVFFLSLSFSLSRRIHFHIRQSIIQKYEHVALMMLREREENKLKNNNYDFPLSIFYGIFFILNLTQFFPLSIQTRIGAIKNCANPEKKKTVKIWAFIPGRDFCSQNDF